MPAGDIIIPDQFYLDVGLELHQLETDVFNFLLLQATITPTAATADPRYGAGGSTDITSNEVAAGGNYSAGGNPIANPTYTLVSGDGRFDLADVDIAQDPGNPNNARWGAVINTSSGNRVVAWLDLGSVRDLSSGPFDLDWNVNGVFNMGAAA